MWNLLPYERLRSWHDFRKTISQKPLEEAVKDVEHLWSYAPYQNHYLHVDEVHLWPGPWEFIYENYYCNVAKALGIVYTLYLTDHRPELDIRVYNDPSTMEQYNLVFVEQGKYVLNYLHDEVVNKKQIDPELKLKKIITSEQLGLHKIQ